MTKKEITVDDMSQWINASLAEVIGEKLTINQCELLIANFREIANRAVSGICARILRENPKATKLELREILLTYSKVG